QGVTRVPRTSFGNAPGRPVDEPLARRVVESQPEIENLPRRVGIAGSVPSAAGDPPDGRGRHPVPEVRERPTGASSREAGEPLDDELRRSRIYQGRQPRATQPTQSSQTPAVNNPAPQVEPAPPTPGAVNRPEPTTRPMPRPRSEPVTEPRMEPRSEPRMEPRSEPRIEEPRPERRIERPNPR